MQQSKLRFGTWRAWSLGIGLLAIAWAMPAHAQYVSESFALQTGWNSIYLQIDPAPAQADVVFAGTVVTSCWSYQLPPTAPLPTGGGPTSPASTGKAQWLLWLPASNAGSLANTLRELTGSRVYLVEASSPGTLTITGVPNGDAATWRRGFNLGGFRVRPEPGTQPFFSNYLAASAGLSAATVWRLDVAQNPVQVTNLPSTRIGARQGYWLNATADVEYDGPIYLDPLTRRGIDYGKTGLTHQLKVENLSTSARTVTVSHEGTLAVSPPGFPAYAGDMYLTRLDYGGGGQPDQIYQHPELGTHVMNLDSATLPNGSARRMVKVEVTRAGLLPAELDDEGNGSTYQTVLKLIDASGWQRIVPVSAQVQGSSNVGGSSMFAGLWVGDVTVNAVSWVTASLSGDNDSTTPRPIKRPFIYRIIIHVDAGGVCRLLTEVTLLWQDGQPGDPNQMPPVPPTPGHYVLATPSCSNCGSLTAGGLVDGEPFARRISTAAFSFVGERTLTGSIDPGGTLSDSLLIAADDRLNPYRHLYHPDHDGNQAGEVYDVVRNISLSIDGTAPENFAVAGWGDRILTGSYFESVNGINKDTVYASGNFELRKVSSVPVLNNP